MNIWILYVCMENVREREWENCFSTMMAIQQVDWNEEQMNVNEMREKKTHFTWNEEHDLSATALRIACIGTQKIGEVCYIIC